MSEAVTSGSAESRRVRVNGEWLEAEVRGSGTPLVLIHGWAMDRRVFARQVTALAKQHRVISFDRRGFGQSGGDPDLRRESDDLDAIADALAGGNAFHLLGLSQGGRIALRYAASRPQRLRSLILQGAAVDGVGFRGPEHERIPLDDYVRLARAGRMDEVRIRWLSHPLMQLGEGHPVAERQLRAMVNDYAGRDLVNHRRETYAFDGDVIGPVARAGLRVLLLTGARESEERRRLAALLLEAIPGARERVFANSGHLANMTEADAYNEAVLAFCSEIDSPCPQPASP